MQYFVVIKNGCVLALETTKSSIDNYTDCTYTHWDISLCGPVPQPEPPIAFKAAIGPEVYITVTPQPFVDTRTYAIKRACAYRMEADPLYTAYRASSDRDGVEDAELKQAWLDCCTAIHAKYPKPE